MIRKKKGGECEKRIKVLESSDSPGGSVRLELQRI